MKQLFLLTVTFISVCHLSAQNKIGIGTNSPQQTLDVIGTTRTTSIMITGGTPTAGKVLTSTGTTGAATWQTPASGGGGSITRTDTLIIPFTAFFPSSSSFGYSDAGDGTGRSPVLSTVQNVKFQAPVILPVGAIIKAVSYCYTDNSDLGLTFTLYKDARWNGGNSSVAQHFGLPSNNGGATKGFINYSLPNPVTIENAAYWVEVLCTGWTNSAMTVCGARFIYTMTYVSN